MPEDGRSTKLRKTRRIAAASSILTTQQPTTENESSRSASPEYTPSAKSGYMVQWHWGHYVYFTQTRNAKSLNLPSESETLSSIPLLYHHCISTLSKAESACRDIDLVSILAEANIRSDRKILKPARHPDEITLFDQKGSEYSLLTCRKEHLKSMFEPVDGLLARSGVCPLLFDVWAFSQGRRVCVGGAGRDEQDANAIAGGDRNVSTNAEANLVCRCAQLKVEYENFGEVESSALVDKPLEKAAPAYDPVSNSKEKENVKREPEPDFPPAIGPSAEVKEEQVKEELNEMVEPPEIDSADVEKLKRKIAMLQKQVTEALDEADYHRELTEKWRNKFIREEENNRKLWTRMLEIQKQMRYMSRPVQTALSHQGRLGIRSEWY